VKKFIFIDNDSKKLSESFGDLELLKDVLEDNGIDENIVNNIEAIYDFRQYCFDNKDNGYSILYDVNNIICTWSAYTTSNMNSLDQLLSYLGSASRNDVKNKIYICGSGLITRALNSNLKDLKNAQTLYGILQTIETNYILARKDGKIKRLRVTFSGYYENVIITEDIDLNKIINE